MVRKYITRDFTDHVFTTEYLSDEDEYIKFELFSFDPEYTKTFVVESNTLQGENVKKTNFKSWACFQSGNKIDPMEFTLNYNAKETGLYRIDILYEQNSNMFPDKDYNTKKDLVGWYDIYVSGSKSEHSAEIHNVKKGIATKSKAISPKKVKEITASSQVIDYSTAKLFNKALKKAGFEEISTDEEFKKVLEKINSNRIDKPSTSVDLTFDGENNVLKRKTIFKQLNAGNYNVEFAVPHNCYVFGAIIRKIITYTGTNDDEAGTNLQFTQATLTNSDMIKPTELQVTIGYDNAFECNLSPSGLYMDYMDECNLYVRNSEGDIERIFGGYVSTPLPDANRRKITIHCADRLKDGENKYILDQLLLQGGDGSQSDYAKENSISFKKQGEVLKYLCELYEVSLSNNISNGYVVGEKYDESFTIAFGKKKDIKTIPTSNGQVTINKNSVTLRNSSSGKKKQTWTLYQASKKPINLASYEGVDKNKQKVPLNLHITYGLGNPKTEHKSKESVTTDVGGATAGSQKWSKCGVSADGKYIMAIGLPSAPNDSAKGFTKTVFERKCPFCGTNKLYWGYMWSGNFPCTTRYNNGSAGRNEGHIYCDGCDADFSVQGYNHEYGSLGKKHLKKVSSTVKSSKEEAYKLSSGKMEAVPSGSVSISAEDIFKAIKAATKGWKHSTGTGSTASYLEKHGVGDCFAWSEKISKELKRYKVNHKIVEYNSGVVGNHRSVLYQNSKGKYVDFPYREYGFPKGTYNTSGSKSGRLIYAYKQGGRINQAKTSGKNSKNETIETTTTNGYDKDKPFQAYLDIVYSLEGSLKSKKYHVYVDFTQKAKSDETMSGLKPVWVNNSTKTITLAGFLDKVREYRNIGETAPVYLHTISFITPKIETKTREDSTEWYTYDKNTIDNSSCKMLLHSIAFNSLNGVEPSDLGACGKSVNEIMKNIVEEANYLVDMDYGLHRVNDKINFRINNNNAPVFIAREGDDNNILEWGNISYNPANELFNMSRCVFKKNTTNQYFYVDSKVSESILKYQEQCTLITDNDGIGEKEAYWNARHNAKFNPEQTYTYTITVKGFADVKLKDLVSVTANTKKLNTLKEVESITLKYDHKTKPILQTELGLGELAPDLQVKQNIRLLRDNAKKSTTSFSSSALPISNEDIFEWEF